MIKFLKEKFVEPVERLPYGFSAWLFFFAVIILLRNFGDALMWTHTIGHSTDPVKGHYFSMLKIFNVYALAHIHVFLITVCAVYLFTKERIENISKVFIVGWLLCWIVPLSDWIITRGAGVPLLYHYDLSEIAFILKNAFNPFVKFAQHSYGERIELLFLCVGASLYAYVKTKNILKSILIFVVTYFLFILLLAFVIPLIADPVYYLFPIFNSYAPEALDLEFTVDKINHTSGLVYTSDQKAAHFLLPYIILFSGLFLRFYSKSRFMEVVRKTDWALAFNYIMLTVSGVLLGYWRLGGAIPYAFNNPTDYSSVLYLAFAVFFAFEHVTFFRIWFKSHKQSDSSEVFSKNLSIAFLILAFICVINVSYWCFLYMTVFLLLYYFYYFFPVKIYKAPVISNAVISLTCMFAVFTGMGLVCDREAVHLLPSSLWIAGFTGFFLVSFIKDRERINRIFYIVILAASFIVVPLITGIKTLLIPAAVFSVLAAVSSLKENHRNIVLGLGCLYYIIALVFVNKYMELAI